MFCWYCGVRPSHSKTFIIAALIIILTFPSINFPVAFSWASQLQWSRTYGPYAGYAIIQTIDGGYAIAGSAATNGPHGYYNYSSLLIKTDSVGETQWRKTYNTESSFPALSVMQTNDSGYALSGHGGWLLKLDAHGNVQWNKTYGLSLSDTFAIEASDGGFVLAGWMRNNLNGMDTFLVKTNKDGFVLWNETLSPSGSSNALVYALLETKDGEYALTGQWGNGDFWFAIADSAGNLLVNRTYKVSNSASYSESFASTIDGGYILAGGDGSDAWLVKTDSLGNAQWNRNYKGLSFVSVKQTADGGYMAVKGNELVKTDASGNVQWDTGSLLSGDLYSIIVTKNGGYAVTGTSNYAVLLAKFAPESANEASPFSITWIVISVIIVAVAGIGLWIYFKKHKRQSAA
jgi:hypothetical protein